ncbi:uncharacterized protein SETTUDRAFT_89769 [Exserohilum turcica Et28A]|uniref:Uncharacterized protein n=1 Tax=Exserohilum turcicum (strain 28A) TaxID=671987 RepID=R0II15_EXST2|nr:uncharacterized protein SETTUDRAFT_89769 [Exserohilum turcica Et28A]EOA84830.1 hypothetical protein SETTUDRAFT_89769 [Exserohilum turcica Et28A]
MESERSVSTTLPRNFMFHYRDGQAPRTPEPEPQPELLQPPPPPRQVLKVRRRRATMVINPDDMDAIMDQRPIPTIEAPEVVSDQSNELPSYALPQDDAFLSPGFSYTRMISPPKTPAHQVRTISHYEGPQDWSDVPHVSHSDTSSRPTSSSGFSDSSLSSCDSIGSFMSGGGSCTSLEDELSDPFSFCPSQPQLQRPVSPLMDQQQTRSAKKLKLRATFTEEMDYHLWMTYMNYLQDPTVTPFKALPSTTPPNGVCHRVARMARKTWKGPKQARAGLRVQGQVGTADGSKPTKGSSSKSFMRYPSEKQCRKRLRDLAKQKPTLSAHYQRLLRRSPSPLQSSPPPEEPRSQQPSSLSSSSSSVQQQQQSLSSPFSQGSTTFSTRDMNVSLATSTAPSMQLGNPLSQLAKDITPRPTPKTWSSARSSAHQKSQSLHIGLGLGLGGALGSPFNVKTDTNNVSSSQNSARTWHGPSTSQPPRLGSPFQLHAPRPKSKVFKRRALHNSFEGRARNRGESFVNEIFGAPAQSSHRGVRNRGFSLGDMTEGARRLPLANDPSGFNPFADSRSDMLTPRSPAVAADLRDQSTTRLGSPFVGRTSNTFPRSSMSHSFEAPASFEQRFAAMPSDPARQQRS